MKLLDYDWLIERVLMLLGYLLWFSFAYVMTKQYLLVTPKTRLIQMQIKLFVLGVAIMAIICLYFGKLHYYEQLIINVVIGYVGMRCSINMNKEIRA